MGYQNQALVISAPHVISCEKEKPIQETLVITQLPCDEVDEDLSLESLFFNTLSHEILSSINLIPLSSSFFVAHNPLFFDHSLDAFAIYFNPYFNMIMPIDYDIA